MKSRIAFGIATSALLCALIARPLWSDDGKAAPEMPKPGAEHARLAKLAGKWDVSAKFWMGLPDDGKATQGSAEFKAILDGWYVQQEFTGTFMGAPYKGAGMLGYNQASGKYTNYWSDSAGSMPMLLMGTSADGGKTVEYPGEMPDGKGGVSKYKTVATHKSDDEFVYEMYEIMDGKDVKSMELTYTRKK
ncbi:MAG: DUF1579 domain-containing protein [Planctomycetes bacterium]|nr:DUF1579 domain-containing protein [Planctomycetota bacterium]